MVESGDFREDLWYRINTFEIRLPPLRERIDDIPLLARHLASRCRRSFSPDDQVFTAEALAALREHCWPGNVRELANVVEHAMILCERLPASTEHLPSRFAARRARVASPPRHLTGQTLREIEMQAIYEALERHGGNKPKTADELGISLKTLYNKLNQGALLERTG